MFLNNPIDNVSQAAATASTQDNVRRSQTAMPSPFSIAKRGTMTQDQKATCHRAVAKYIVKDMQPFTLTTKHGKAAFSYYAPTIWNKLPKLCTSAEILPIFKSRLKTHLLPLLLIGAAHTHTTVCLFSHVFCTCCVYLFILFHYLCFLCLFLNAFLIMYLCCICS